MKTKIIGIASTLLCTATVLCSGASSAEAANLVVNGGFEASGLQNGTWNHFGAGEVLGWIPTAGSRIEIRNNVVGTAYEGQHFAEVDSHYYDINAPEIGFFQDIATEIGKQYKLSFAYGPRQEQRVNGDNLFSASFGNFIQEFNAGNSNDGWKTFTQTITATSTNTRLKFLSLGIRDTLGANVDDVSVVAVPEPASMLGLLAIGAIGAASTLKQTKKQEA
ncbi:PEP-CTERM sorting domain-containing protein [Calothrix sp. 336/3]|uniref:PEP-CTERM sorting domain-containing protein n=1 Tax=Calothrix sp. 336/3 TaxID=1337936 RepID=UPI0004E2CAF3|nr:PEP-CTERM sorting domain-containing protein [Calothrix sp. 336/3]AKG21059.1 hypothetical protein IJ00_06885 [Calothrix sp. 336/3]